MSDIVTPSDIPGWIEVGTPQGVHFVKVDHIVSVKARSAGCVIVLSEGRDLFLDLAPEAVHTVIAAAPDPQAGIWTARQTMKAALLEHIEGHHLDHEGAKDDE